MKHYILNEDGTIDTTEDVIEWARSFENDINRIAEDVIGDVRISTVFLGLDHGGPSEDKLLPLLFETMIFDGKHDEYQERCSTLDQAKEMHKHAVEMVRGSSILSRFLAWLK